VNRFLLFIIALLCADHAIAQNVVERKNKLSGSVTEKYQTLIETDKQVKQGTYQAFYNRKVVVAMGKFTNDKKTGPWRFYDTDQKLLQTFNYDANKLLYEAPESEITNFRYIVDKVLTDSDKTTRPVRIGGRYYGYVPYLRLFKVPSDIEIVEPRAVKVVLELLVSPGGRLADYKIHLNFDDEERVLNINPQLINEEDRIFIPATLNNEPIACRIFIECFVNARNEIDM
jgi:hypothetical protein